MGFTPFTQIPSDLLDAAVALAAVLIGVLFWRWKVHLSARREGLHMLAAQRALHHEREGVGHMPLTQRTLHHQREAVATPSIQRAIDHEGTSFEEPLAVFLSHSGKQKAFVEHLYNALEMANQTVFFDKHSLPKGSPFPAHIKQVAHDCKLGVVVLSEDFLTSKWPMLELDILVRQKGPDAKVLPLFFKLHPEDLKSSTNLLKWRDVWEKEGGQDARYWEQATKDLDSFNGEVFIPGTSEVAYINNVVKRICNLVPCNVPYDLSFLQGHDRLAKEITSQFEHVDGGKACMIGLHGVGGLGKTTLCKLMVNFFTSNYVGRSCLIEFPTNADKSEILQECKRALKKLANLSDTYISQEVHHFDQVVELMRKRVRQYDVFLALDNVWESSQEEAKRLLGVGFSARSRILVTSRSEQLLRDMLRGVNANTRAGPLPAPEQDEALQIFQTACEQDDLKSLVEEAQMTRALRRCMFSGNYHPLALKALGLYVKSVCAFVGPEEIGQQLSRTLGDLSDAELQGLDGVIRLNYEMLPEHKQHMFLDIAVTMKYIHVESFDKKRSYASAQRWLHFLYKGLSETYITRLLYELALNGLIRIEGDAGGEKLIKVHDLYCDLAEREAANSGRFFVEGLTGSADGMEWEKLERVVLSGNENPGSTILEELQQQECPKLQVLYASGISTSSRGICLGSMPALCVLILKKVMRNTVRLGNSWDGIVYESADTSGVLDVRRLVHLQMLCVESCSFVELITGLKALRNLQRLRVVHCPFGAVDLSVLICCQKMETLDLYDVGCMFPGVARLGSALKHVRVKSCKGLKKMENLRGLRCLESLQLQSNEELEEVKGECLSSTLKDLLIQNCKRLRRIPSLIDCVRLQTLKVQGWSGLLDLPNAECRLQRLHIEECDSITKMDVECLGNLEDVRISRCAALEEIGDVGALPRLEHVRITECPRLKKVGDFQGIIFSTRLTFLKLEDCESLEESPVPIDNNLLSSVPRIQVFVISRCGGLKEVSYSGHVDFLHFVLGFMSR